MEPPCFTSLLTVGEGEAVIETAHRTALEPTEVMANVMAEVGSRIQKETWRTTRSICFFDHIPENDKKQDQVTVSSIAEALCYRIRKELPVAE